jgi:hypothetical protein
MGGRPGGSKELLTTIKDIKERRRIDEARRTFTGSGTPRV